MQVSVVIPALNEAENIGAVVRELPWGLILECVVADNGSTDATAAIDMATDNWPYCAGRRARVKNGNKTKDTPR